MGEGMSSVNVSSKKYEPAPLPKICAPRLDLLKEIDAEAEKRLIYISAPAGSGKTVAALLWARASGRKTIWLGLDELDNSVSVFYRMVCAGIISAQPQNQRMKAWLQSPSFNESPVEHTINLLSEIENNGDSYALVLDDLHSITNMAIFKSLLLIQRRLPDSFVTLVLSRGEPTENYKALVKTGAAALIDAGKLAFDPGEIKDFFKMMGRRQDESEGVFKITGGWAFGVNAIAQSDAPFSDESGGEFLDNYIKRHVWDDLDASFREFMLRTAAADKMPVALCEKITGDKNAGQILESLRARNIFITREDGGEYRYHHLFLEFLRAQPEYIQMEKKKLWALAAEHYINEEDYLPSRKYALKSGNIELNLLALEKFMGNRGYSFDEYMNYSPEISDTDSFEALCERCPVFYITYAWTAFVNGDAPSFEKYTDRLMKQLPVIFEKYPRFMETGISMIVLDYRTPFSVQVGQAALYPASINMEDESLRTITLSLHLPFFHRSCRDFCELTDRTFYGGIKETYGKLLKKHYDMVMHSVGSGLLLEQNRAAEALTEARKGTALLTAQTSKEIRFGVYMHLAAVYLAQGKNRELDECLAEIGAFVNKDAQFLRFNFMAFTARIKILNGDGKAAKEWLENYFVIEDETLKPYRVYQYFTTLRAYILLGETGKAGELAKSLRQFGKSFNRPQDAAEAGVLSAVVSLAAGYKDEAVEILAEVLSELQPFEFIRIIADEGQAVVPLLKKLVYKTGQKAYAGALNPVYVNNVYLAAYAVGKQRPGILLKPGTAVKLSHRQKLVLQLLAEGHRREGIIERTGLTVNTVKTHLRIAYEKLDVKNAEDAVAKARELGIL